MLHVSQLNSLEREYLQDLCDMTLDSLYAWDSAEDFEDLMDEIETSIGNEIVDDTLMELVTCKEFKEIRIENLSTKIKNDEFLSDSDLYIIRELIEVWGFCDPLYDEPFVIALEVRLSIA